MKGRFIIVFGLLLLLLFIGSCRRNQYKVNTTSVTVDLEVKRLEKDLFESDPAMIDDLLPTLKNKYGDFLQFYSYVIKAGEINDTLFSDYLLSFCTDRLNNEVYASVNQSYPDVRLIEEELEKAFSNYIYYFPKESVPAVFTCITGFNRSIITADSVLGIGLDRYLGSDCEYYPALEIYGYLAARMNSWNIVPDCMYAWGAKNWNYEAMDYPVENVLCGMIHEGKLRYFEKCMIPEINDTLLFGFTGDQMKFCRNNENQMWMYLIENDLLFSTDKFVIRKLTGEAPFTTYFTNESPGKAAVWQGFRIIESFMSKNKDVSLAEMMSNTDVQTLLDGAKYKPQ